MADTTSLSDSPEFTFSPGPDRAALDYLRAKRIQPSFDYRDVWRQEHASAFTIAKMAEMDLLADVRDSLANALEQGKPFAQWQREIRPMLEARGWWGVKDMTDPVTGEKHQVRLGSPRRLKIIYQTNLRTAHAAGQWARAQRTKATLPYFRYTLGPSVRHRPEHAALEGTTLPVDDPFWDYYYPPTGYNCKCRLLQVGQAEADAAGGPSPAPKIGYRDWKNKRTGQVERVPVGITPGFDTHPGKVARDAYASRLYARNLEAVPARLGSQAMSAQAGYLAQTMSKDVGNWVRELQASGQARGEARVVGALSPEVVDWLENHGHTPSNAAIVLSDHSVLHSLRDAKAQAGKTITVDDVGSLPESLANPVSVLWDTRTNSLVYVSKSQRGLGKVAIRLEFKEKTSLGENKGKLQSNVIRTMGLDKASNLMSKRFDVIQKWRD